MAQHTNIPLLTLPGLREKVTQIVADGGSIQNTANCIYNPLQKILQYSPSMVFAPYALKTEKLYGLLGTDFSVTRSLDTATRVNSNGLIESVASGVPRLDYPLGGAVNGCPALLVEPSAQNLIFRSEEFATSPWGAINGATVNVNTEISPDGTQNADRINLASGNVNSIVRQVNRTVANSTTYTLSCFYKNNTIASGEEFSLVFNNNALAPNNCTAIAFININAGTATYSMLGTLGTGYSGTATGRVENYGNGWYRFSLTFTVGTAGAVANADVYIGQANTANGRSYYAWGAQLEVGSVATSYIPTTTAAVTRSADVVSKTGVSSLIGQTEGTVYLEIDLPNPNAQNSRTIIELGASPTRIYVAKEGPNNIFQLGIQSSAGYNFVNTTNQTAPILKFAIAYASGNNAFYLNGTQISTASANANPTGITSILLGAPNGNTPSRIRAAALYTTRLSNDQLAELTRL